MYKETTINLPNGMQVIVWNTGENVCLGVANERGFVVTDRKLSVSEADQLSIVADCP